MGNYGIYRFKFDRLDIWDKIRNRVSIMGGVFINKLHFFRDRE